MNNFLRNTIICHRGIHDNVKIYENTLEAFKLAMEKKYIIELDIHKTKDNKIVVFHDYNTQKITGKNLLIESSNYEELNNQDKVHIPTLEEVLHLINGSVPLLIEIKQKSRVGALEKKLMSILNEYHGEFAIQSFNPKTVYWFKKHYPNILRGQLSYQYKDKKMNFISKSILKNMLFNSITKPHFVSYKYDELSPKQRKKLKEKHITTLAWTIDNREDYNKYIDNYDNLICEKFI